MSTPATVWESGYSTPVASYQAIPASGFAVTFSHGLGVDPLTWDIGIICTTADVGYALNDYISAKSLAYPPTFLRMIFLFVSNLFPTIKCVKSIP